MVITQEQLLGQIEDWEYLAPAEEELPELALHVTSQPQQKTRLTHAEAKEDIRFLFRMLEHGYAGYGFFNTDDRFETARSQILQTIDARGGNAITLSVLAELISSHLSFIQDCHFRVDDRALCRHKDFWYWEGVDFFEEDGRYWFLDEGQQVWVTAVNNEPPANYMLLGLNDAGDPVYHLGIQTDAWRPADFALTTSNAGGENEVVTDRWLHSSFRFPAQVPFEYFRMDGVPIIVSRSFGGDGEALSAFVASAEALRAEPIIIVDIRGNSGGSDGWPRQWLTNLQGLAPPDFWVVGELQTRTALLARLNWPNSEWVREEALRSARAQLSALDSGLAKRGWIYRQPDLSPPASNSQLIVVLIDKQVGSAAEGFVADLARMPNVVFVGTNTSGAVHFGEVGYHYLPNSGLRIQLGTKLFLTPSLEFIEGKGFQPDLWVPPDRALERVLRATDSGWLQPVEP